MLIGTHLDVSSQHLHPLLALLLLLEKLHFPRNIPAVEFRQNVFPKGADPAPQKPMRQLPKPVADRNSTTLTFPVQ